MRIDWVTVAAQIVNFLVLVWLLQRFLYRPVTRAMARRQERVAARVNDAERARREAEEEAERHREMQRDLDARREAVMEQARQAAAEERRSLEAAARAEVDARRDEWMAQIEARQDQVLRELRQAAAERFWALARRALDDLADETLEERIALRFVRQVEALDEETVAQISHGCARHEGAVTVRSRFALSANARRRITTALHERLGLEARIEYVETPGLACGVELIAGSRVLRWNLEGYLDAFESEIAARLDAAGPRETSREPAGQAGA